MIKKKIKLFNQLKRTNQMLDLKYHIKQIHQFQEDYKFMLEHNFWTALSDQESKNLKLNQEESPDQYLNTFNCIILFITYYF